MNLAVCWGLIKLPALPSCVGVQSKRAGCLPKPCILLTTNLAHQMGDLRVRIENELC